MEANKLKKFGLKGKIVGDLQKGKSVKVNNKTINPEDVSFIQKGKKIAFLWDTGLCENCNVAARDADLLIIESSYSEDMKDKAEESKHLTSVQAAEIAKKAGVKKLILTHMSQRYEKEEGRILNEAKKIFSNSLAAKDFMMITL